RAPATKSSAGLNRFRLLARASRKSPPYSNLVEYALENMTDLLSSPYRRLASLKDADEFACYLERLGLDLGFDRETIAGEQAPLGQPYQFDKLRIGNRFCILPMEGWDGETSGAPSELTMRRWRRFGESGAKLIWGGEAVAVRHDGRANPNQLLSSDETTAG